MSNFIETEEQISNKSKLKELQSVVLIAHMIYKVQEEVKVVDGNKTTPEQKKNVQEQRKDKLAAYLKRLNVDYSVRKRAKEITGFKTIDLLDIAEPSQKANDFFVDAPVADWVRKVGPYCSNTKILPTLYVMCKKPEVEPFTDDWPNYWSNNRLLWNLSQWVHTACHHSVDETVAARKWFNLERENDLYARGLVKVAREHFFQKSSRTHGFGQAMPPLYEDVTTAPSAQGLLQEWLPILQQMDVSKDQGGQRVVGRAVAYAFVDAEDVQSLLLFRGWEFYHTLTSFEALVSDAALQKDLDDKFSGFIARVGDEQFRDACESLCTFVEAAWDSFRKSCQKNRKKRTRPYPYEQPLKRVLIRLPGIDDEVPWPRLPADATISVRIQAIAMNIGPETRRKMSELALKRWATPEFRARVKAGMDALHGNPIRRAVWLANVMEGLAASAAAKSRIARPVSVPGTPDGVVTFGWEFRTWQLLGGFGFVLGKRGVTAVLGDFYTTDEQTAESAAFQATRTQNAILRYEPDDRVRTTDDSTSTSTSSVVNVNDSNTTSSSSSSSSSSVNNSSASRRVHVPDHVLRFRSAADFRQFLNEWAISSVQDIPASLTIVMETKCTYITINGGSASMANVVAKGVWAQKIGFDKQDLNEPVLTGAEADVRISGNKLLYIWALFSPVSVLVLTSTDGSGLLTVEAVLHGNTADWHRKHVEYFGKSSMDYLLVPYLAPKFRNDWPAAVKEGNTAGVTVKDVSDKFVGKPDKFPPGRYNDRRVFQVDPFNGLVSFQPVGAKQRMAEKQRKAQKKRESESATDATKRARK